MVTRRFDFLLFIAAGSCCWTDDDSHLLIPPWFEYAHEAMNFLHALHYIGHGLRLGGRTGSDSIVGLYYYLATVLLSDIMSEPLYPRDGMALRSHDAITAHEIAGNALGT